MILSTSTRYAVW